MWALTNISWQKSRLWPIFGEYSWGWCKEFSSTALHSDIYMIYSLQQLSAIFIIHSPIIPIRLESDRDSLKVGMARRRMKSNKTRPSSDNSHMWGSSPSCEVYCRPKVLDWLKSCYGWRNSSGSQQIKIAMAKDTSHIARCELLLDGLPFFHLCWLWYVTFGYIWFGPGPRSACAWFLGIRRRGRALIGSFRLVWGISEGLPAMRESAAGMGHASGSNPISRLFCW